MYKRKDDVDMLNAVKSMLADVSSVSPSSEQLIFWALALRQSQGLMLETLANILFTAFSISTSTLRRYIVHYTMVIPAIHK